VKEEWKENVMKNIKEGLKAKSGASSSSQDKPKGTHTHSLSLSLSLSFSPFSLPLTHSLVLTLTHSLSFSHIRFHNTSIFLFMGCMHVLHTDAFSALMSAAKTQAPAPTPVAPKPEKPKAASGWYLT